MSDSSESKSESSTSRFERQSDDGCSMGSMPRRRLFEGCLFQFIHRWTAKFIHSGFTWVFASHSHPHSQPTTLPFTIDPHAHQQCSQLTRTGGHTA